MGSKGLTDRRREVLQLIFEGKSNKEIGRKLGVSMLTAKNHVQSLLRVLGATRREQAVYLAIQKGVLEIPNYVPISDLSMRPAPVPELPPPVPAPAPPAPYVITWRDVEICPSTRTVRRAHMLRNVRNLQWRLLLFFVTNAGHVYSRQEILDAMYGTRVAFGPSTVDVWVRHLRKLFEVFGYHDAIETVRGVGYRLHSPDGSTKL